MRIAQDVGLRENSVAAALALFEQGATGPFVAAYRKETTGGLDAVQVRAIQERASYYKEVQDRRASLVKLLTEQKKLTDELRARIEGCYTRVELDDLHNLFRPRRRTRAAEAIEKGLEPLAEYLWNQEPDAWSLEEHADVFIDPAKNVASREQALQGASDIVAEWISENLDIRKSLRETLWKEGALVSTVVPAKTGQRTKYNMYYDRREPVATVPSHRVLAIRRGTKEGVLTSAIEGDIAKATEFVVATVVRDRESPFAPILETVARDSYNRILRPLIETEVRAQLKERADREAIRVFQENLANLLLSPPAGPMVVLGIDPGKGEECKVAVVDAGGKFLEEATVSPLPPKSDVEGTRTTLRELLAKHAVQAIALGTGAGAREIETIVRDFLVEEKLDQILIASVNDAGIAIYSSSRVAREEFPELSIATRCAISLARRLQDPLGELVKIDPKLIGVGQYQHDVDQKELHRGLLHTVQFCVNSVGVDVNTAGPSLLRYVSGLNDKLARRIVGQRAEGPFKTREALRTVPGDRRHGLPAGRRVHPVPRGRKPAGPHRGPPGVVPHGREDGRIAQRRRRRPDREQGTGPGPEARRFRRRRDRAAHPDRHPGRVAAAGPGPAPDVYAPQVPVRCPADRRSQGGDDSRRDSHERHQLRSVRRRRCAPGRSGPPEPDVQPLHP